MVTNDFNPHFYQEGGVWFYADGSVLGGVDGDVDLAQSAPPAGRGLLISEWSSHWPGQGNSKRALKWLRGHFKTIVANCVGTIDEDGPDISVLYWAHMKDLGLVDEMLADDGTVIVYSTLQNHGAVASARELTNCSDRGMVYEIGSDDTFWNSRVIQDGDRFNVSVYDADGDRRADREGSFTDRAVAIAFADQSVVRFASPPVKSSAGDQDATEGLPATKQPSQKHQTMPLSAV